MRMKKSCLLVIGALLLLLTAPAARTEAGVSFGLGINIGLPVLSFQHPPQLVVIPGTYAYYVADTDADILFYRGRWYRTWGDRWYWGRGYNGPWFFANSRSVPRTLRRLPQDYRHGREYTRIPYYDLNRNWRTWERERRWEKRHDWWRNSREEQRNRRHGHDRHNVRRDQRDRRGMSHDQMRQKDQQEGQHNMRDRTDDRKRR